MQIVYFIIFISKRKYNIINNSLSFRFKILSYFTQMEVYNSNKIGIKLNYE